MSLKETGRIWVRRLKNGLKRLSMRPVMLYGYRRHDGKYLSHTRISTSAHIGNRNRFFVEDHVYIGHFNVIDTHRPVHIGEGCQITNFVTILTHSSHVAIRLYGRAYAGEPEPRGYGEGEVHIGPYTFIGPFSVIMPGSRIGKGCIVSAHSYVDGEVPDFAVVRGAPAGITGDTRELDRPFLERYPELRDHYEKWR